MKKLLLLILVLASFAATPRAETSPQKKSYLVKLDIRQKQQKPTPMRSPMRVNVEACYDAQDQILTILYDGEADGEVNLYYEGSLVDISSEINTCFSLTSNGEYTIEIVTENWVAEGNLTI